MKTVAANKVDGTKPARPASTNHAATANDPTEMIDVTVVLRRSHTSLATRATAGEITDATIATLRPECPSWDTRRCTMSLARGLKQIALVPRLVVRRRLLDLSVAIMKSTAINLSITASTRS